MNFLDLFRATLPETVLEVAALLVLAIDLLFLKRVALKIRVAVAALLGVAGCVVAGWALQVTAGEVFRWGNEILLASGGFITVAQAGTLVLTALTLLLLLEERFTPHIGEFVAVVLMAAAGGLLVCGAQDLLVIFIGLELLSLGLYILTAFHKTSGASAEAALKYYLFGGMSAAFLLFGFSYLYGLSGSTNLLRIFATLAGNMDAAQSPFLLVAFVLIVTGLGFKVAAAPFHFWAPDAYEGAPAPAAALIASASKVASFALILNFTLAGHHLVLQHLRGADYFGALGNVGIMAFWLSSAFAVLAAVSMVFGNLAALAQSSVRRLLAYSAIAHAGYLLLGVAYGLPRSGAAAAYAGISGNANAVLYYILTYGLTTVGAFGVVAVVERATGSDRLDAFSGLYRRNKLLAGVLLVLFLSLAGIPPLVGFWAKFNLFAAVLSVGAGKAPFVLVVLALAMSAVSLYYYLQVLKRAFVTPAIDETPIKAHWVTTVVLLAIALAVILAGCFPALLQGWIEAAYR